jgi:acetylornithine deacetylase/succinyl-diaminopimelate desuccinylase-like protein
MPIPDALFRLVDEAQDEIVSTLCDLVRIPTVNTGVMPTGHELPLCHYLQRKLAADGLDSQILVSGEDRGNLVARLPGCRGRPRLLLMGHTDVVPIDDASQWRHPPFSGIVEGGRVWGRGAADMKDLLTSELMALLLLKRAGVHLAGDLILAAAADEETGGAYGFGWLAQHAPEVIRAEYGVNEGGGSPILLGGRLAYAVPVGEKGRHELSISLRGKGAHAATPWLGQDALYDLGELLRRIQAYRPEVDVSHLFFTQVLSLLDRDEPITAENVDAVSSAVMAKHLSLGSALRGFSRMTLVPTMAAAGVKSNSVPASCTLTCDVRTLPRQDEAYVRRQVDLLLDGFSGATYELATTAVPSASPYDTELSAALRRATCAAAGRDDITFIPSLTLGFTDSRLVRPLGATVYGFNPGHPEADPNFPANVHGADESTDIRSLLFRTKVLLALAVDLLGLP